MTENEKLFVKMLTDSNFYLQKNKSVWDKFPAIVRAVNELVYEAACIDTAWLNQGQFSTTSQTSDKYSRIDELVSQSFRLSRKLVFCAKDTKNVSLLEKVSVPETWFTMEGEAETFKRCSLIASLGYQYLDTAAEYGVTQEELALLNQNIETISKLPSEVAMINNERKAATQAIKTHSATAKELLDLLDDAFEGIIGEGVFLDGWFEIRKVKKRNRSKKTQSK